MRAEQLTNALFRRLALLAAAAATLHGLIYIPLVDPHVVTDSDTYVAAAEALLDGRYSTPLRAGFYYVHPVGFFDITGVRIEDRSLFPVLERQTFRPPGYPLFLAALGGGTGRSQTLVLLVQALILGAATFLLAVTVRRWWGGVLGLLAAGLYALDPYSKHYVTLVLSEGFAPLLAVGCAYAGTRAWQERSAAWWAFAGALAGSLTLVRAVFVLAVPLVVAAALLRAGARRSSVAAAVGATTLLLAPWLIWTASVTGRPVLASYGEGYNLLVAAHGEAHGHPFEAVTTERAFLRDFRQPHRFIPSGRELRTDPDAHPRYVRRADAILRAAAREKYRSRLTSEPLQVGWETLYRAAFLWSARHDWYHPERDLDRLALAAIDWLLIAFALVGLALALGRRGPAAGTAAFLALYTVVLATHHVEARFAMPVRGLMLAFVALAIVETNQALTARRRSRQPSE